MTYPQKVGSIIQSNFCLKLEVSKKEFVYRRTKHRLLLLGPVIN